ncbi:MAG TPA: PDDEXK nuclease domain-containing protein [Kofleriaceae bacterium]|nr:PDDEXK nuclease domain-containing protein [Kofleriaceae bacterium]
MEGFLTTARRILDLDIPRDDDVDRHVEEERMNDDGLYERVARILEQARGQVARTVNTAMVQAYWLIGREIVAVTQEGSPRARYGNEVVKGLAKRPPAVVRKGFQPAQSLPDAPILSSISRWGSAIGGGAAENFSTPSRISSARAKPPAIAPSSAPTPVVHFPSALAWSHYLVLLRVSSDEARAFYEIEATRECWSVRQLERQIGAQLFERLTKNRNPEQIRQLARRGQEVAAPADVIKDPFVLEFLDVSEPAALHERDLEQAIIDRLEAFLLEMGKGFCFVGRQKRLTVEGDHFYVDLVFYNRLLRCFVLVDLKLGTLTHQDLGQMLMYVNYYDRAQRVEHENKTIGIVLCSEQNEAMVKITLPENDQIIAATYRSYLPTEAELAAELERGREEAERVLRLTASSAAPGGS